jgi:3-phosphoshikimate 1-carboxyvinyltransferase
MNIYNAVGKIMQRIIFSEKSSLSGLIDAPPSKSHSHRLLFLALISTIPIRINKMLRANDVDYSMQVCGQLGLHIEKTFEQFEQTLWIKCTPPKQLKSDGFTFNCGNSGTTVRFLIGLSLAILGKMHLSGEFFARNRPIIPMLDAMKSIGTIYSEGINGVTLETPQIIKSNLKIPGHFSSQFLSGLIYGIIGLCIRSDCALQKKFDFKEFTIETTSPQVSIPYLDLTQEIFEQFGIEMQITKFQNGRIKIIVPVDKNSCLIKDEFDVPGDYSAIAPLICGNALFGEKKGLLVRNLSFSKFQLNHELLEILGKIGGKTEQKVSGLKFFPLREKHKVPKNLIINCERIPDLFPSYCVLGSYLMGTTTLTNIKHIRFKESNRVENMVRELRNFGLEIEEDIDSVKIRGNPNIILHTSHTISDIKDHRVLMALIIFAVGIEYEGHRIIIENIENIGDSYPRFVWDLNYQIGAKFDVEEVV